MLLVVLSICALTSLGLTGDSMTDLRKASVEVPDDDKPDVITSFRKNRITLDSYIVPVVFEKSPQIHKEVSREREQEGRVVGMLRLGWLAGLPEPFWLCIDGVAMCAPSKTLLSTYLYRDHLTC